MYCVLTSKVTDNFKELILPMAMAEHVALITCPVCLASEDIVLWAMTECGHPLCYTCCTRMRVLGAKKACPVCRKDTDQVVFCKDPDKYADLVKQNLSCAKRYGIHFQNKFAKDMFHDLQKLVCVKCKELGLNPVFGSMAKLKDHLRQEHEVQFCKLCLQNTDLFIFERAVFTRQKMAAHVRTGDENGACKGHPMCKFCDERFYDSESLNVHVKKNHFWCHFCENDGKFDFYPRYSVLKDHFRKEHFLCELGECVNEKFVNAFRTKVDLQAHVAKQHTKGMGKQEARQAKQIDLGFNYSRNRSTRDGVPTIPIQHLSHASEDPELPAQDVAPAVQQRVKQTPSAEWPQLIPQANGSTSKQPATVSRGVKPPPGFSQRDGPQLSGGNLPSRVGVQSASSAPPRMPPPGLTPVCEPAPAPMSAAPHRHGGHKDSLKQQEADVLERLSGDKAKIGKFKVMCRNLLQDRMSAHEYYLGCSDLFGDTWLEVFEACICGLPDMDKKSELRLIHTNCTAPPVPPVVPSSHKVSASSSASKKGKKKSKVQRNGQGSYFAWGLSGRSGGTQSQPSSRLDESDFPSLSTAAKPHSTSTDSTSTWSSRLAF